MTAVVNTESTQQTTTAWYVQGSVATGGQAQRVSVPCGRFQIGRRSDVNLTIAHASVSKIHAELIATDMALFIRDLGSTNGTFVNGVRITEDTPLGAGDVIQFAEFEFLVGQTHVEKSAHTMVSSVTEWKSTLTHFHRLMTNRSVIPFFQPIVRLSDDRRLGFEVLARSSVDGLTSPKEMFGAAERFSLATQLSVICREKGVEVAREFANPGLLFLNTHPSEHPQAGLVEALRVLRNSAPDLELVLELNEAAVTKPSEIAELRAILRDMKIQLAYDDFGSGQARLMELAEVTPDYLKFDLGLIRGIDVSPQRQQLVAGLVQIVRDLGIRPLAEGIETAAEAEVCRQIGFTHAQGFFYGKPMAAEALP